MKNHRPFNSAEERYQELGVDVQRALKRLATLPLSIHCWQADDVGGFETPDTELSGGGIQVTGNYPGKARTLEEIRTDLQTVFSLLPGNHRLALHASYGDFAGKKMDRDQVAPEHFDSWANWAGSLGIGLDFNSTFFSHPLAAGGFTLSSKDDEVRRFWIRHAQACRQISAFKAIYHGTALHSHLIARLFYLGIGSHEPHFHRQDQFQFIFFGPFPIHDSIRPGSDRDVLNGSIDFDHDLLFNSF